MKTILLILATSALALPSQAQKIKPLANEYITVAQSQTPEQPLYTPSILCLPSGRLIAAFERGKTPKGKDSAFIYTSDDQGETWIFRKSTRNGHARLFSAGDSIYYMGHQSDLRILRSDNEGTDWSEPSKLTNGQSWHASATNTWKSNGNIYLVMERRMELGGTHWTVGQLAPILMRAKETDDLTKADSWTHSSALPFYSLIEGYKENDPQINFFGVPFFRTEYMKRIPVSPTRTVSPMGWLEGNVVQILDPNNYWYDPSGHTFYLFMRANTGGTGYAALAKVVEKADGTMITSIPKVPSGKETLFLPLPGGQMRFHILYDDQTKLYWLLSSQATDSMTRADRLPENRFDLPNNERHRMVLHFSQNMVDWCFAGLVATGRTPGQARHYASMDIDRDDLVILSRSGDENAKDAHETNLITFHRIQNFRDLVY